MPLSAEALLKRLILADISFLTTKEKRMLDAAVSSAKALSSLSLSDISLTIQRTLKKGCSWNGSALYKKAERASYLISALQIQSTFYDDVDFPALLREMPDPPYALFYRGNLSCLKKPCISVVGTRRATFLAREAASTFSCEAAGEGCTVVSGLAYGIDVASHKGALQAAGGTTAAVLASGIDTITPSSHTRVARQILERGGCILSEYTPGTPAVAFRFIQRDRLIAALSPATVVVQAPSGSGALLTAGFALEYGRDVLFHAAAFSPESELLERANVEKLQRELSQGRNVAYKLENSPQKYVSDGASIIKSFSDYLAFRAAAPGTLPEKKKPLQEELF